MVYDLTPEQAQQLVTMLEQQRLLVAAGINQIKPLPWLPPAEYAQQLREIQEVLHGVDKV